MSYLVIRLLASEDGASTSAAWAVVDNGESGPIQQGELSAAATASVGAKVCVLLPSAAILLTRANVPTRQRQRLLKAVPYALEEQLATDVDNLHFALGQAEEDDQLPVAVIARAQLDSWLAALRAAGIEPEVLMPDVLALPLDTRGWGLLLEERGALLRTGRQSGFATDAENVADVLALALDEAGDARPELLQLLHARENADPEIEAITAACEAHGVAVVNVPAANEAVALMAPAAVAERSMLNLLQGDYSREEQLSKRWRPWRPAAALFGLWIVVQAAVAGVDYFRLDAREEALREQINQVYRTAFPEAQRVVDARAQMEQQLKVLRQGASQRDDRLLELLANFGMVMEPTDTITLHGVRFQDGKADVDFEISDLEALDRLKQRLTAQPGIKAEILAANSREGKVEARVQLYGSGV